MNKKQDFWDKQAKKYDHFERQFEPVFERVIPGTITYFKKDDVVLDYGCATGTKTMKLAGSVRRIHGLDFSPGMIGHAMKKRDETGVENVDFSQGTIFGKEFRDHSFDAVTAYGIMHLLDDKELVVGRIYELLKPGGLFVSTTACLKEKMTIGNRLTFSAYLFVMKIGILPMHLELMCARDVEALIRHGNFHIVESQTIFHGMTIEFIVARKP